MEDRVTSIQIKLKDYSKAPLVLAAAAQSDFRRTRSALHTWEDKQGPLLAAIEIEHGILNVLLFLIIAVAGFGILAIFSMIVVEKTRDIGILKALGASNGGVMKIFLGYGLLLGVVGAALGTRPGPDDHAQHQRDRAFPQLMSPARTSSTGRSITSTRSRRTSSRAACMLVNLGAIAIAVLFSVLPALRAALLHPVRALRYE